MTNQHRASTKKSKTPLKRPELINNTGFALTWTKEEDKILEDGLARYSLHSSLSRYTLISLELPTKTTRDVAMRCRWLKKRLNVEKSDSVPQDAVTNELLSQNEVLFEQISANLASSDAINNLTLFSKSLDNITKLIEYSNANASESMKNMSPLPENVNVDLFLSI